jgi:hypothetical protein
MLRALRHLLAPNSKVERRFLEAAFKPTKERSVVWRTIEVVSTVDPGFDGSPDDLYEDALALLAAPVRSQTISHYDPTTDPLRPSDFIGEDSTPSSEEIGTFEQVLLKA